MSIGENIRRRRTELGFTLLEVAERLGVKEATVQRYESGSIKTLKYDTITNLSDILQISPVELMGLDKKLAAPVWDDEQYNENCRLFKEMNQDQQAEVLKYMKYIASLK